MCRQIVQDADRTSEHANGPALIPVLIDDLGKWTPTMLAVFLAAEGSLVNAVEVTEGGVEHGDVKSDAPHLVGAINEAVAELASADPTSYGDLVVKIGPDLAVVTGAQAFDSINRTQVAVRQTLTAMLHKDLRKGGSLVALAWDDSDVDSATSSSLFSLAQRLPELWRLPDTATAVLLIGSGALRAEQHCAGDRGIRYQLRAGAPVQRRSDAVTNSMHVRAFSRLDRATSPIAVLFLGAGASISAGLQLGDDVRNEALSVRFGFEVDASTFEDAARELYRELARAKRLLPREKQQGGEESFIKNLTLERVLREEQNEENTKLSSTLQRVKLRHDIALASLATRFPPTADPLRKILQRQCQLVLIEVNFDQVIESRGSGLVKPFVTEADFSDFDAYLAEYKAAGGLVPLVKLHGDLAIEDTIVANIDETQSGLSATRLKALKSVRDAMSGSSLWWYIGYSMRDLDLVPVFGGPDFSDGLAERWVAPLPDPNVVRFIEEYRAARWRGRGRDWTPDERLISMNAEDFWTQLAAHYS